MSPSALSHDGNLQGEGNYSWELLSLFHLGWIHTKSAGIVHLPTHFFTAQILRQCLAPKMFSYFFPYHIFEDRVEVFHILGTFCFRSKTIIHIEEDDSAIFSHGAEKVKNLFPIDILPSHAVSRCETKLNFGQVQGSSLFWQHYKIVLVQLARSGQMITNYIFVADQAAAFHKIPFLLIG